MKAVYLLVCIVVLFGACDLNLPNKAPATGMEVVPDTLNYAVDLPSPDSLYNKILGSLVGSAIGDAMGAPTEMWSRQDRQRSYGFVENLDPSFIDPSPEGLWDFHLPSGTTTDDTRWKKLMGNYAIDHLQDFYGPNGASPYKFADLILDSYQQEVKNLKQLRADNPVDIEYRVRRLNWLQEWAMVAEPFVEKDLEAYTTALHRFYGGELLCAGMLYAPALGLVYPADPLKAYQTAYRLGIFDQGYARDITGLTAALTAAAMSPNATKASVMEVFRTVDPHDYFRSRLFGREAFRTYRTAEHIAQSARETTKCQDGQPKYLWKQDSLYSCQLQTAFELLDDQNQHAPAHAQEILLVTITSILFSDFDFQQCMEFIVNYGRDNDTSGAVAGAILGAYLGYDELPPLKDQVLKTNRDHLGIDLEALARELTDEMIRISTNS